jgi:hypothetical protein
MLRLYTDESPGLKVDPVVVLVLSLGFIMSVVALHSELIRRHMESRNTDEYNSHREDFKTIRIDEQSSGPEVKHCIRRGRNQNDFCTIPCLDGRFFESSRRSLGSAGLIVQLRIMPADQNIFWWTAQN